MIDVSQLTPKQRDAVNNALDVSKRCAAITGAAGTGKTTIMQIVYEKLKEAGYDPVVAAPTGKAAKRIREATGLPSMTLHMLLEYTAPHDIDEKTGKPFGATYPRRDNTRPLDYDTVLADEYAMVNRELHANLVKALPTGGRLIVFGDDSQLPPIEENSKLVGEPSAFKMIFDKFNGVTLDKIHRQDADSGIINNASRIKNGMAPLKCDDFDIIYTDKHIEHILEACANDDYTLLTNQIITPSNNTFIGTVKLNILLQANIANANPTFVLPRHRWHEKYPVSIGVGEKVILKKNWYDVPCHDYNGDELPSGMFNGEVGLVKEITDLHEVLIDTGDRIVTLPPVVQIVWDNKVSMGYPQRDLQLAYVVTTHNAQGCEFDNVVYTMSSSQFMLLNRRNLYTGVTRAKKRVTVISDMRAMSKSINTKEPVVFSNRSMVKVGAA